MDIQGSVAFVSGANRGLGAAYVRQLLEAGAKKIYMGTRHPIAVDDPRLQRVQLDITNAQDVADTAQQCQDVTILVNNAGIMRTQPLLATPSMEAARAEMETNYFGTLAMCRAFAPILGRNGGGALVNMLSIVSWFTNPLNGSYSVSKAAEWAMTNGIRIELRSQETLVVGVHAGFIDTDMTAGLDVKKVSPEAVASQVVEAIQAGREEVMADQRTRDTYATLFRDPQAIYRLQQQRWDDRQRSSSH